MSFAGDLDVVTSKKQVSEQCSGVVQIATQARQVLTTCEQRATDKVQLEYDPRNPFDICSLTFTPIYRQGSPFHTLLTYYRHVLIW